MAFLLVVVVSVFLSTKSLQNFEYSTRNRRHTARFNAKKDAAGFSIQRNYGSRTLQTNAEEPEEEPQETEEEFQFILRLPNTWLKNNRPTKEAEGVFKIVPSNGN